MKVIKSLGLTLLASFATASIAGYPLHDAVRSGSLDSVQRALCDRRCDLSKHDGDGNTPLHLALLLLEDDTIAKFLHLNGGDVKATNNDGSTSLHIAACMGKVWEMRQLLIARDSVDMQNVRGRTALHYTALAAAIRNRPFDMQGVDVLLKVGAEVGIQDNDGRNPLHLVFTCRVDEIGGADAVVRSLVRHSVDLEALDKCGDTPAHVGVRCLLIPVATIRLVLERGSRFTTGDSAFEFSAGWNTTSRPSADYGNPSWS